MPPTPNTTPPHDLAATVTDTVWHIAGSAVIVTVIGAVLALTLAEITTWRRAPATRTHPGRHRASGPARGPHRTLAGDLTRLRATTATRLRSIRLTRRGRADAALERHLTRLVSRRVRELTMVPPQTATSPTSGRRA